MITGFNTDVKHRDVVFHVQTEDKGETTAWVESLVYVGGRVLARRRATYKEVLERGEGKPAIAKMMERQHRLMIAQIRKGHFDVEVFGSAASIPAKPPKPSEPIVTDEPLAAAAVDLARADPDRLAALEPDEAPVLDSIDETGVTLDQVIFDYLASAAAEESLVLLMDESAVLVAGSTAILDLRAHASRSGRPVVGARVSVRMISTFARPVSLADGETDGDGSLQLSIDVPPVAPNSAALIISAASEIGTAEIKHLL